MLATVAGREIYEDGLSKGKAQILQRLATKRFGKVPAKTQSEIGQLDYLKLGALADEILTLPSLAALQQWLAEQMRR
jgi:hypothetical protein